jgi:cyclohexadienyl dehydratase
MRRPLRLAAALALLAAALAAPALRAQNAPAPEPAASSALDRILKAGVLRACTPGDYKPFSFRKPDGSYEGLDIDLAQSLAAAMGAKLEIVKTSWPTLMADFTSGGCDIAIGGISVTTERLKRASFSAAHMVNGKTPLVRCEDAARFQTVADIDKPGVRVITNPGGTNERFAKANFKAATVTVHAENLTIFDELLQKRADVFVTEAAEALVQQKLKPGLCAVNPARPLQYSEVGFMLPRGDMVLKGFVDQWLHLAKASGDYQKLAAQWLPQ